MLSLVTNGYTAAEVQAAMLGADGVIRRRWRFEIYDRFGNFLRKTYSVKMGGGIRYVESQSVRRGGNIQIDKKDFTLVDDYFDINSDDNIDLEMPTLYSQIYHESAIGYWRLGESSGTAAADATGNGRTGTYTGGYTLHQRALAEAALDDGSVLLNGSSGYVVIADHASLDVSNLTIGGLIKTSYTGARQIIAARDNTTTDRNWILRTLGTSDTGQVGYLQLVLFFSGPTTVTYTAPVNVCDGEQHSVYATYNGAYVRLYVDGAQVYEIAETRTMLTGSQPIYLGALGGTASFFNGYLDEMEFYGYAISNVQSRNRFQAGSGQLYEIDFLHDQIKAYCAIYMSTTGTDGTRWAEYPRGLFNFVYPDVDEDATGSFFDGLIQDATFKLDSLKVRSANYTIATTRKYREALQDLFTYAGFTTGQYSIAVSTVSETTLPISKEYPIGTSILFIMNDLLHAMNYRQARADSNGIIRLDPWVSSGDRATELTLTADENSIIRTSIKKSANLKDVFNDIYLKRQGSKGVAELIGTAQITRASHPMAISRVGYRTFSDLNVVAADSTAIAAMALKLREEKGRIAYRLALSTPLLCVLDNDDLIRIVGVEPPPLFSAAFLTQPDKFLIVEWSEPFSDIEDCQIAAEFYIAA